MILGLQDVTRCGYKSCLMPERKEKFGFQLPASFAEAFNSHLCAGRVTGKEKWIVLTAAILSLLELPEDEQNAYISRVKSADTPSGSFEGLVREAEKHRAATKMVTRTQEGKVVTAAEAKGRGAATGSAGKRRMQPQ